MSKQNWYDQSYVSATRKEHPCEWCEELIAKGSEAIYAKGLWNNEFFSYYMHHECREAQYREQDATGDDEWLPHNYYRGMTSYEYEEKCCQEENETLKEKN